MQKKTSRTTSWIFSLLALVLGIYSIATGANGPGLLFFATAIYIFYKMAK